MDITVDWSGQSGFYSGQASGQKWTEVDKKVYERVFMWTKVDKVDLKIDTKKINKLNNVLIYSV